MKKSLLAILLLTVVFCLSSCFDSKEQAMTEPEQAAKYNLTVEEYKEMKNAAAQMNMTIEDHMKHMGPDMDMGDMDMSDDSSMIEDDVEMDMDMWTEK